MGIYHGDMIKYYLYLLSLQYTKGYEDDAFISLDEALNHARKLESLKMVEHKYTSPLVKYCSYTIKEEIKTAHLLPKIGHDRT